MHADATDLSVEAVKTISERSGTPAKVCCRGPFRVIQFSVESRFLLEVLTPEMLAKYQAAMHFAGREAYLAAPTAKAA